MNHEHNKLPLRHFAFTLIAMFALISVGVWAARHSAINSNQSQQTTVKPHTLEPATAPAITASTCDASLWNHIYHAYRLKVLQQCSTVTGTIDHIISEKDGDTHIRLKLDPAFTSLLDAKNVSAQHGDLVLEPVCENAPTQSDAVSACAGYKSNVVVPTDGTRVSVVGSYVLDADHGWDEIHPVTSITVIP